MKKLLLIPALLSASVAFATPTKKVEISPMIGYNIAEGNLGFEDNGYMAYGLEAQFNTKNSTWSPEISVIHSNKGTAQYTDLNHGTAVTRVAFNGVKTFDAMGAFVPFAKAGFGVEMIKRENAGNKDSIFIDAGAGVKFKFNDTISLKTEAIYMDKYNAKRYDSNLVVMAGLTFAFGDFAQKPAPVVKKETPKPVVVEKEVPKPVVVPKDSDKDGVINTLDKCPNTPLNAKVDANGCAKMITLKVNFKSDSTELVNKSSQSVDAFVEFLKVQKSYKTQLEGYSDSRGNDEYNLKLSQNRADAVKDLIISKGISADRVTAKGMGEVNPIADNTTAEGRAQNRRIEAKLSK